MAYSIRIAPAFEERLDHITSYIEEELGLPQSAAALYDDLASKFSIIAKFPRAYMVDEDATRVIGQEVHSANIRSFKLLYWIDDVEQTVLVFALRFQGESPELLKKYPFL